MNEASGGIENFASVARVIGAGHLVTMHLSFVIGMALNLIVKFVPIKVVQTEPSLLAAKIRDALVSLSLGESRAKL